MARLEKKSNGPSITEVKMKGDIDRLRREIIKLKRDGGGDGGAAKLSAEALVTLQTEVDGLEETRERLSKLYFTQLDENRSRTTRLHQMLKAPDKFLSELVVRSHYPLAPAQKD